MTLQTVLILSLPVLLASLAQFCFKKGVLNLGDLNFSLLGLFSLLPKIFQNIWLVIGLFLFGLSFLFYLFALSKFQLNIVYPMVVSAGIAIITILSWILFREGLSTLQILGIIAIIFGIFLIFPR